MDRQLSIIAGIAGASLSELFQEKADSRPGCPDHQTLPLLTEAEMEMSLQENFS
jgi:hypothetical protein